MKVPSVVEFLQRGCILAFLGMGSVGWASTELYTRYPDTLIPLELINIPLT